ISLSFTRSPLQKATPALPRWRCFGKRSLNRLQICGSGFAAARIGLHIERKLLALVEAMQACMLDRRDVNEHIGAAVVLNDEAVAPLGIEEFNGTCGHQWPPYKNAQRRRCPIQTISHGSHIRILRVLGKGRCGRDYKVRRNRESRLYSDAAHTLQSW